MRKAIVQSWSNLLCLRSIAVVLLLILFIGDLSAHGTQVAYCVTSGGRIRVYVEHWHGNISAAQTANATLNIIVTNTATGATTTSATIPDGVVWDTTVGNLPDCKSGITVISSCPGRANVYNDWVYWDFTPPDCFTLLNIEVANVTGSQSWYFDEACAALYPVSFSDSFIDCVPPTMECPDDLTVEVQAGCTATVTGLEPDILFDDCTSLPDIVLSYTLSGATSGAGSGSANGNTFNKGTTTITYTAVDEENQASVCSFDLTIDDSTGATINCPADVTMDCNYDLSTLANATATDFCGVTSLVSSDNFSGLIRCSGTGDILRTWTATDGCGNISSCVQTITIQDTTSPTISCPANVTINADANCKYNSNPIVTGFPTGTDDCPDGSVSFTYTDNFSGLTGCGGTGTIVRTWTARDECGNVRTCNQRITVQDILRPTISCPAEVTISMNASCNYNATPSNVGSPMATDNCGAVTTSYVDDFAGMGACNGTGFFLRTWTAVDLCGNTNSCKQKVNVVDNTNPTMSCPSDITIDLSNACAYNASPTITGNPTGVSDNCTAAPSVSYVDDLSGLTQCSGSGRMVRTWTVEDDCGNTFSCRQTITVEDNTNPVITCPADVTLNMDASCMFDTNPTAIGMPIVVENCSSPTMNYIDDISGLTACGGTGVILRTWTVVDACANAAFCVQRITIQDITPPSITCPTDVTINMDASCNYDSDPSITGNPMASDNCTSPILSFSDNLSGLSACGGTGVIVRTWTAEDDCNNSVNCTQNITIQDISPPTINCPMDLDLEVGDPTNDAQITAWLATVSGADNCGAPTLINNFDPGNYMDGCGGEMQQMVTFTATDDCGNSANCMAMILIGDMTPPVITCPADLTLECGDPNNMTLINNWLATATATDAGGGTVIIVNDYFDPGMFSDGCGLTGIQEVLFTATDDCNLMSMCMADIIIEDTTNPSITCPADVSIDLNGSCNYNASPAITGMPSGMDVCMQEALIFTYDDNLSGLSMCSGTGAISRTWTVTDNCGLTNTCIQIITVEDNMVPIISCPADLTLDVNSTCVYNIGTAITGSANTMDNCPGQSVNFTDDLSGLIECSGTGVVLRTWTVTDACANTSSCIQSITIQDVTNPTILCPADVTLNLDGTCSYDITPAAIGNPIISDNCLGATSNFVDDLSGLVGCSGTGLIIRTWTVTDACGNSSNCIQNIMIQDVTTPSLTCPADATIEYTAACQLDSTLVDIGAPIFSDNCPGSTMSYMDDLSGLTGCGGSGSFKRMFQVTDLCGNTTTCEQIVTVDINVIPSITCPVDVTLAYDEMCALDSTTVDIGFPTTSGGCNSNTVTYMDDVSGLDDCGGTGSFTRNFTVDDGCGNMSLCVQSVVVEDNIVPSIECPSDLTVYMDAACNYSINPSATGNPTGMDNCSTPAFSYSDDITGLTECSGSGEVIRTWTATDDCGNTTTCTQNITIEDNTDPTINCPADITIEMPDGCIYDAAPAITGMATASDNCPGQVITYEDNTTGLTECDGTGFFLRTWTVTDACDITSSCVQKIDVVDTTMPTIDCPADMTIEYNESCALDSTLLDLGEAVAMDNCLILTVTYEDDVAGLSSCSATGTFARTFTVADHCGNTASCIQTITVEDNSMPTIACPVDVTVDLNGACVYDLDPAITGSPTGEDNCATPTFNYIDDLSGLTNCSGTGVVIRTWVVSDACANTSSCTQNIIIQDVEIPTITCQVDVTVDLDNVCDYDIAPAITGNPTIDDNCPGSTFAFADDLTGLTECSGTGMIIRTWTVTDACANTATCTQVITIQDVEDPSIVCPVDVTIEYKEDCSLDSTLVDIGSPMLDDNCMGSTFEYSDDISGLLGCAGTGTFMRTFVVTDACGNTASCTQTVTVEDNTNPSLACPEDVTINLDSICAYDSDPMITGMPTGADNCSSPSFTFDDDLTGLTGCSGTGTIIRTWTVMDVCGNSSSCNQNIVVQEVEDPTITCPADVTVDLDEDCAYDIDPAITGNPTIGDNCPMPLFSFTDDLSGLTGCSSTGIISRTWLVVDACGNSASCIQTITIQDVEDPSIGCPADVTVDLDGDCVYDIDPAITGNPMVDDNCPSPTFDFEDDLSGLTDCSNTGVIVRTWTVTDACGNTATCDQNITIQDVEDPTIICPADITIEFTSDCSLDSTLVDIGEPILDDNCIGSVFSYSDDLSGMTSCSGTGSFIRNFMVSDVCGNTATCSQLVTVEDNTPPTINCPEDTTIFLDSTCDFFSDPIFTGNPTGADNCSTPTYAYVDDESGLTGCSGTGLILRTWTATDVCGNSSSCVQSITVEDNEPPFLTCPEDVTIDLDEDCEYNISVNITGDGVVEDNCLYPIYYSEDDLSGLSECSGTGVVLRTWTAEDVCGNTVTCVQSITIQDIEVPTIFCPSNVTVQLNADCSMDTTLVDIGTPIIDDNCPSAMVEYMDDLSGLTGCGGSGTILRTFIVTDACANSASCVQTIVVENNVIPSISCPADVTIQLDAMCEMDTTTIDIGMPMVVGGCNANTLNYVDDLSGLSECSSTGFFTRTFSVDDGCGNASSCTQTIVVEDNIDPSISCPEDVTLDLDDDCAYDISPASIGSPTGMDNCSTPVFTFEDDVTALTDCSGTGSIERTWTATDDCGNTTTCVQNILIRDVEVPTITCPMDVTLDLDADCAYDLNPSATGNPVIDDNCPAATFDYVDDLTGLSGCSGTGMVIRTWTVTDACNNSVSCTQSITIQDVENPSIVCPPDSVVEFNEDCTLDTTLIDIGAPVIDDNCIGSSFMYSDDLSGLTDCGGSGFFKRNFTVMDACGNTATCEQTVTVEINVVPSITCPVDLVVQLNAMCEMDTTTTDLGLPTVNGGCNVNDINYVDDTSGLVDCGGTGSFTRTFTVDDGCGNTSTCVQTITVEDNLIPSIDCPMDLTLDLDADCNYDIDPAIVGNPTGADNCSTPTFSYTDDLSELTGCSATGTIYRTWVATDACGNSNSCIQSFVIQDVESPTITCPGDTTVDLDGTCSYDIDPSITGFPVFDDNCPSSTFTYVDEISALTQCSGTGVVTRTWTVKDACDNLASCIQLITIQEVTNPTIICPADIVVEFNADCSLDTTLVDIGAPFIDDNCPGSVFQYEDDLSGLTGCGGSGSFVRTFTVTDACGNTSTCAQTVTVEINVAPSITCPANVTVQLDAMCAMDTTTADIGLPIFNGGCNVNTINYVDDVIGLTDCGGTGIFTRTFTIDDGCGNTSSCVQEVVVEDMVNPSITCPEDITVDLDGDCAYDVDPVITGNPSCADNCSMTSFSYTDDLAGLTECSSTGVILRTWTATDDCGNTATCIQSIGIQDVEIPTIICPADTVVEFTADCTLDTTLVDIGAPMINDNCPAAVFEYEDDLSGLTSCGGSGTFVRNFTVTDACGNTSTCAQTISVEINVVPSITCPANVTVQLDAMCAMDTTTADIGLPMFNGGCNVNTISYVDDVSALTACGGTGTFTRTFTVDDGCGNTSSCVQEVVVEDMVNPSIICPEDVTVDLNAECEYDIDPAITGNPSGTDNCSTTSFSYTDDLTGLTECSSTGIILRTWTATDDCGNTSTCVQSIGIQDVEVPTIICPADIVVEFNADCTLDTTLVDMGAPTIDDNCPASIFEYNDDLSGLTGCGGSGTFVRNFMVTDACGNTATCAQTITVENNVIPSITCPVDVTVQLNAMCAMDTTTTDIGIPMVDGGCNVNMVSYVDDVSGLINCGGAGTFTRSFTVDDGCGNLSSCVQTVTVEDLVEPSINCPADVTVDLDSDCVYDIDQTITGNPTGMDNCSSVSFSYTDDLTGLTGCNATGVVLRTWTATDECGNFSTCVQRITIQDVETPTITCPADIVVEFNADCSLDTTLVDIGMPIIDDNCSGATFTYSDDLSSLTGCGGSGSFTRNFVVTDGCGNSSSCEQIITVEDNLDPTIVCPIDVTVDLDGDCVYDIDPSITGNPTVTDNCSTPDFNYADDLTGLNGCSSTGILIRTWTATDACGNTSTCVQQVTIQDVEDPSIVCPADIVIEFNTDCSLDSTLVDIGSPIINDNCPGSSFTYMDDLSGLTTCGGSGFFTRNFIVTDACGNTTTCAQTVTVEINVIPSIECPVDVTVQLDAMCAMDTTTTDVGIAVASGGCNVNTITYIDDLTGLTGCGGTGTFTRTFTVDDGCGNSNSCVQTIFVEDNVDPIITGVNDYFTNCKNDYLTEFNDWVMTQGGGTATDNCSNITWTTDPVVPILGTDFDVDGATNVTFIATDDCGNSSSHIASFNVSCLAVAKEVADIQPAASRNAGNFDVTYSMIIENIGNVDLNNLSLIDDLSSSAQLGTAFVGISGMPMITVSTANMDPILDGNYDGTGANPEMFDAISGLLSSTQFITIVFTAEVDPDNAGVTLPLQNTATASGSDPNGDETEDDSADGDDPEGPGGPTPLTISSLHASKTACGFAEAESGIPGNYDVQFIISIQNTGTEDLTNLSLEDDLSSPSQFGNAFVGVTVPPNIVNSTASLDPIENNSFDGSATDPKVLDGVSGLLKSGEIVSIKFTVELDPNISGAPDPLENQATAGGTDPEGEEVEDDSDSGIDPDGNNPDGPGDTGGHDDPSPLILPGISVFKNLVNYAIANDGLPGHFDLILQFGIKNVGNVTMTDIDLFEDLGAVSNFGPVFYGVALATQPMIVSSTADVNPTINASYDGQLTNPNIFDGSSGILKAGEEIIVELRVTLDGLTPMIPDTIHNSASGGGAASDDDGNIFTNENGDRYYIDDLSDTGDKFESNNPGEVGDTGGHNDPTCIPLLASVGDYVWKDLNGNGVQEVAEPGLENVTVRLYDCAGNLVNTTMTDGVGYYIFEFIIPGSYYIDFDISGLPLGCEFTLQDVGSDDLDSDPDRSGKTPCFDLMPAEHNPTIDAGVLPLAKVGDYLWHDCNGNGIQDSGEDPLPYMQVNLYDGSGNFVDLTVTDVTGHYIFEYLYPGDYYIEFIYNSDYSLTFPNIGNNEANDSDVDESNGPGTTAIINLSAGECDLNSGDAGFYKCVEIGDMTFFDTNLNNVWDASENGVNGLKIVLYRELLDGSYVEWDITYAGHKPGTPSDDGYFKFCAPPGKYYLEFAQPPYGMVPSLPNRGNFESIDSDITGTFGPGTTAAFSVTCEQGNCDIGAGYHPMGTVGDYVWLDNNQNGLREVGEPGISNVLVQAYDQNGNMLGSDNTDGDGTYLIDYLQSTDVFLKFLPPSGYASTIANASNDSLDSDIDHSNGTMTTAFYHISSGEHQPNVDAGLVYGAVPVEWINFTGESRATHHALEWTVASQINVSHYEVERSIDGTNEFSSIGKILAKGSSSEIISYEYDDYDIQKAGFYYYRIVQYDLDGNSSYTKVIVMEVEREVKQGRFILYPNPLVDELTIEMELSQEEEAVNYELRDSDGKLVRSQTILSSHLSAGRHLFYLDMSDLSPGTYVIRIQAGANVQTSPLIIVDN